MVRFYYCTESDGWMDGWMDTWIIIPAPVCDHDSILVLYTVVEKAFTRAFYRSFLQNSVFIVYSTLQSTQYEARMEMCLMYTYKQYTDRVQMNARFALYVCVHVPLAYSPSIHMQTPLCESVTGMQ